MAEEEEPQKWRCHLSLRLQGKVVSHSKCSLPLEFQAKFRERLRAPLPRLKIKLPVSAPKHQTWKIEEVPFKGRLVKLAVKLRTPEGAEAPEAPPSTKPEKRAAADVDKDYVAEETKHVSSEGDLSDDLSNDGEAQIHKRKRPRAELVQLPERPAPVKEAKKVTDESAMRKAEQLRRRKEDLQRVKEEQTSATIEKILNAEGSIKKRVEDKSKRRKDQDSTVQREGKNQQNDHVRYVMDADGKTVAAFTKGHPLAPWMSGPPSEGAKPAIVYTEPCCVVSLPWWAAL